LILDEGHYSFLIISGDIGYFLDIAGDFSEEFAVVVYLLGGEEGDVNGTLSCGFLLFVWFDDGLFEATEHSIIIIEHENRTAD
jgi:hypothetical protein